MDSGFWEYLTASAGEKAAEALKQALAEPPSVSVRFNPAKIRDLVQDRNLKEASAELFHAGVVPVSWSPYGFLLDRRPDFTLDPLFHAGAYYVQDSSAMFVGQVFRDCLSALSGPESGGHYSAGSGPLKVLDLCAAPGGKTTDLAASLREVCGENFLLVANEVMGARAGVLADNVALWGDPNVMVTNADPSAFASLEGFFDIIVADVPCSGEGMFRKDAEAVRQWSADNVALCQARQRRIVADVWPALSEGGVLIYSTCTFNSYENDGNVEWIISSLGAECVEYQDFDVMKTRYGRLLLPGCVPGEGQFCAAVRKTEPSSPGSSRRARVGRRQNLRQGSLPGVEAYFMMPVVVRTKRDVIIAVPSALQKEIDTVEETVKTIRTGCAAGGMRGKSFVPSADLALCPQARRSAFPSVELDRDSALAYLHRDAISLGDAPLGIVRVEYCGLPIGFVKNLGNRCNNLHPQSRRIRMNIN